LQKNGIPQRKKSLEILFLSRKCRTFAGIVEPQAANLGVCVKPVHFHYNKTYQLIQFIELNRLLGVSRFVVDITF
jgi:hypothetical protein